MEEALILTDKAIEYLCDEIHLLEGAKLGCDQGSLRQLKQRVCLALER